MQPGTRFGPRHRRFSLRATTPPLDCLPRSTAASLDAVLVLKGQLGPSARSWHYRRNAKRFALAQPPQTASPEISIPSLRGGGETSATTSPQPASLSPPGRTRRWLSSLTQSPVPRSPSQSAGAPSAIIDPPRIALPRRAGRCTQPRQIPDAATRRSRPGASRAMPVSSQRPLATAGQCPSLPNSPAFSAG